MFADLSVLFAYGRHGQADSCTHHARRFVGRSLGQDAICDLARLKLGKALFFRDYFAMGRENTGHADKVENFDSRVAQGQLETLQTRAMLADALGKKYFTRYERFGQSGSSLN
jgi:hypothetical protein